MLMIYVNLFTHSFFLSDSLSVVVVFFSRFGLSLRIKDRHLGRRPTALRIGTF